MTMEEIEAACDASLPLKYARHSHEVPELSHCEMFFPLGFPTELRTNSPEILSQARDLWPIREKQFDTEPIRVDVHVLESDSTECPPTPVYHLMYPLSISVADTENYSICHHDRGLTQVTISRATMRHTSYLGYFFLQFAAHPHIETRYTVPVHAGCVARNGRGVMLCGDSGAGKSTLSYACAKAGWTYVTDDGSYLVHALEKLTVVGNCFQVRFRPSAASLFPEIEGREVVQRAGIGKPSIELKSLGTTGIKYSQSAEVHHLVMLNRRGDANEGLRPYSADVARRYLRQGRFAPLDRMPSHYAMIDRILERGVYELRYRDLDWAIEQLQALAEGAHR